MGGEKGHGGRSEASSLNQPPAASTSPPCGGNSGENARKGHKVESAETTTQACGQESENENESESGEPSRAENRAHCACGEDHCGSGSACDEQKEAESGDSQSGDINERPGALI